MLLGALEAGGTKMVCALGNERGEVFERRELSHARPRVDMANIVGYFKGKGIAALGVSCFGPLDLDEHSPTFGNITTTPKPGCRDVPLRAMLLEALNIPVGIDTDVNGAALGEALLGAGKGVDSLVYYTVGTGIGGGAYYRGMLLHGLVHPEMGHMVMRPHPDDPAPARLLPPTTTAAWRAWPAGRRFRSAGAFPRRNCRPDHLAWKLEAEYLAQMCANTALILSPQRIVLGGGVMQQTHLFAMVRRRTQEILGGYVAHRAVTQDIDQYIVPTGLGNKQRRRRLPFVGRARLGVRYGFEKGKPEHTLAV